jgi:hypothetical protein
MTLKLVDNVEPLPVYNFQDIASCARRFADQLQAGEQGEPIRAIMVLQLPDGIALSVWGENTTGFELLGILEAAKFRSYEAHVLDDDD